MSAFDVEQLPSVRATMVDVYTAAYRVSGMVRTRFDRVAEILNQLTSTHLPVEEAMVSEYGDPEGSLAAPQAVVAIDEILLLVAPQAEAAPRPDMRIPKRPIQVQLALPPFRLSGTVYIPQESQPIDGMVNLRERFMPMIDATIACARFPEMSRTVAAVAVRRDRAHVVLPMDHVRPAERRAEGSFGASEGEAG